MRLLLLIIAVTLTGSGLAQEHVAQAAGWVPTRPGKIVFRSHGTAHVLNDSSVRLRGNSRWQEFTLYFEFQKPTQFQEIRVELLPPTLPVGRNRPRHDKRLLLFDVKPKLQNLNGQMESLEFSTCVQLGNPDDESTVNCIDYLTDTGWTVPAFTKSVQSHQLAFKFAKPLTPDGEHQLALTFDYGGSSELDVLSRLRVLFPATTHSKSK